MSELKPQLPDGAQAEKDRLALNDILRDGSDALDQKIAALSDSGQGDAMKAPEPFALQAKESRKEGKRDETEVQKMMDGIVDGASFVLISPTGKPWKYFRDGNDFYLESERKRSSKSTQTGKVKD
ncbi:MAG: hypothetical protein WAU28_05605, partial [Candidatus Moraniibacteriota bacterium]